MNKDMDREGFLEALQKEGLLMYGTTYLENFKRIQELKKYKEMWEEFYKVNGCYLAETNNSFCFIKSRMNVIKQKYFPPTDTFELIIELKREIDFTELWNELDDSQKELFRKCLKDK